MNCEWTEKISLLIDGELAREEVGEVELHLRACFFCRQTREDFLHLRAQISSYRADLDPRAQRAALAGILAASTSGKIDSPRGVADTRRGAGFGERLAAGFGVRTNAAAWAAASVLLVAGAVFGLILMRDAQRPAHTVADATPAPAADVQAPRATTDREHREAQVGEAGVSADTRRTADALEVRPRRGEVKRSRGARVRFETASAVVGASKREPRGMTSGSPREETLESVELSRRGLDEEAARAEESRVGREFHVDGASVTTRHVEQAQLLLRSFRNVRLTGARGASDLAEERRRSQKLLYRNIVLRREAATKGNLPVERVLNSLEPILIDIANLPDRPEGDEVLAIRERMQRKNIVAMLQVSTSGDR